jgi:hypothetical protein
VSAKPRGRRSAPAARGVRASASASVSVRASASASVSVNASDPAFLEAPVDQLLRRVGDLSVKLLDDLAIVGGLRTVRQVNRVSDDVVELRWKGERAQAHVEWRDVLIAEDPRDEVAETALANPLLRDDLNVELFVSEARDWDDRFLRAQGSANEPSAILPLEAVRLLGIVQRLPCATGIHEDELVISKETDGRFGLTFHGAHDVREVAKDRSSEDDPVAERTNPPASALEDE